MEFLDKKKCDGGDSCCTSSRKCGVGTLNSFKSIRICMRDLYLCLSLIGEGDCDRNSDCKAGLKCGKNNCRALASKLGKSASTFQSDDDCCYRPGLSLPSKPFFYPAVFLL